MNVLQERIAKAHGTQCGFCTPGFVMTMYSLLRNNSSPTEMEIEAALQGFYNTATVSSLITISSIIGNLCRCTGYRPILDGFKTFACSSSNQCCGDNCCTDGYSTASQLFDASTFAPLDPTQEAIFPPKLMVTIQYGALKTIRNSCRGGKFFSSPPLKTATVCLSVPSTPKNL